MSKTRKITTSALLVALATVLMLLSKLIPSMPWGGSVTLASMVPLIVLSLMLGTKWGIFAGGVYALIQMLTGFYPPPTQTFPDFILVVVLDYLLAFGILGIAAWFYRMFGKKLWAIPLSGLLVTMLRYLCHILSGFVLWASAENIAWFFGDGALTTDLPFQVVQIAYSVVYNGCYMAPEILIGTVVSVLLSLAAKPLFVLENTKANA